MENFNVVYILRGVMVKKNDCDALPPIVTKEVNGVYKNIEDAKKMGDFLITREEFDGMRYLKYDIEEFMVL